MTEHGGLVSMFRNPEYTGENRCLPCTAVNTVIAGVLSSAVGVGVAVMTAPVLGSVAGLGVFVLSLAAIYLRGYLVPGTPELTKRYLPERVLALFGKGTETVEPQTESDIDPEEVLVEIGALEVCADGNDLCLTDSFRTAWHEEIQRVEEADAEREQLLDMLNTDSGEVTYEEFGSAFRARVDDQVVGKWESRGAFLADLGSANVLETRYPAWERLSLQGRSQLLNGLRLFIDTCPECGSAPEFGTDIVESCCSTRQVATVSCPSCGARLFETQAV